MNISRLFNDHCGSNAYVLSNGNSPSAAVVIDPADVNSHCVSNELARCGYSKVLIILTHEHFDHMSGVNELRERFDACLLASRICSQRISNPKENLSRYTIGFDISCGPADMLCEDCGSTIRWEGIQLEFIASPGHSAGSICVATGHYLFSGDTLICGVPTVVKLPGGNREALQVSINHLMDRFPGDTFVYPGHGEAFSLGEIDQAVALGKKHAANEITK